MRRIALTLLALVALVLAAAPAARAADTERARITWNKNNDIDLHVYDQDGREAYYLAPDAIPDADLSVDLTDTMGPEFFTDHRDPSTRRFGYNACYFAEGELEADQGPTMVLLTVTDETGATSEQSFTLEAPDDCHAAGDTSLLPDGDADGDGVQNSADNCFSAPNPDQADDDDDGIGNACEPDSDGDRTIDDKDNCPDIANADQADADGNGVGNACEPPPETTPTPPAPPPPVVEPPQPEQGVSVVAGKVSGTVRIRLKNGKFKTLGPNESIPLGSTIDATKGRVRLTSAAGGGKTQTADFYKGQFKITQTKGKKPITQLELNATLSCRTAGNASAAAKKKRKVRSLWGDGKGRFRTKGRRAAATVRGTRWFTQDRCDSTKITVKRGVVQVRDFVKRKNVTVKKGHSYVARKKKRK
jgi:Thrombospondin type 3 repeat